MRVGLFTNAYRPLVSGVVNSVYLIREGLLRTKNTPFIFAPRVPGYKDEHSGIWRFRSISLTNKVEFPLAIPYSSRLFPLIARMGLNVIHTHHPFLLGEVGACFAKFLGIPLVYTFHTQMEKYAHYVPLPNKLVCKVTREAVSNYTSRCDCVICPSPSIRDLLDDYKVTCRVEVLQNAIDTRAFAQADGTPIRAKFGLKPENVLCIFTGRMGLEKNLSFMLHAFKKVYEHHSQVRLMLLGDGPIWDDLQQEARDLGIAPYVLFPGRVDYKEIPAYYKAADLFVMTSTTEVKPLAVLEGMASGLPVVAVDACGTGDTVTNGSDGLLCECSEEAYTNILAKAVVETELRQEMGRQAVQTASNYSIENYTKKLLKLYREIGAKDTPRHHNKDFSWPSEFIKPPEFIKNFFEGLLVEPSSEETSEQR
ncbi:MAG: glycosyltransferase [bacterium]|nr:glycosyltransferase [bacterium]